MHATAQPAPVPVKTGRPRPQWRRLPGPRRRPVPPGVPSWAAVIASSCRRHLADLGIVLSTVLFVFAGATVGLVLIHRG